MERLTRNKFKFTGRQRDNAEELLQSTNGIRPGVWVFDVTDNEPRTPELCPKEGKVIFYVNAYNLIPTAKFLAMHNAICFSLFLFVCLFCLFLWLLFYFVFGYKKKVHYT